MVAKILLILVVLVFPQQLFGDARISSEISTMGILQWIDDEGWSFNGDARGTLDVRSPAGSNVQARLQLRFSTLELINAVEKIIDNDNDNGNSAAEQQLIKSLFPLGIVQVPRAYLRFRFPVTDDFSLRVTSGIDRVTWGVGSVLNAGDLIFKADPDNNAGLLTFDEVRDETAMLFAFYAPLGQLNFLETVVLPVVDEVPRAGIRLYSAFEQFSLESSYLYDGPASEHAVAVSLQRSLFGADVYTGVSLQGDFSDSDSIKEGFTITGGGIYSWRIGYDQQISARIEAMVRPGSDSLLKLYGDIGYVPNRTVQLILRGMTEPEKQWDSSLMVGANWNIFQGFHIQGAVLSMFNQQGFTSETITAGFNYRF